MPKDKVNIKKVDGKSKSGRSWKALQVDAVVDGVEYQGKVFPPKSNTVEDAEADLQIVN